MSAVVAIDTLLREGRLWRGRAPVHAAGQQPSGNPALDAALPTAGWPEAAMTEILLPADGLGELSLVLPTLARLTGQGRHVVLVAPPYRPHAPAWQAAGVDLAQLASVQCAPEQAAWAMEQCLRSGSCGAVLGWQMPVDDRCLRRLQVAANQGQALGFLFRDRHALANPSPVALRLEVTPGWLRVHKCRGGNPPPPVPFTPAWN